MKNQEKKIRILVELDAKICRILVLLEFFVSPYFKNLERSTHDFEIQTQHLSER